MVDFVIKSYLHGFTRTYVYTLIKKVGCSQGIMKLNSTTWNLFIKTTWYGGFVICVLVVEVIINLELLTIDKKKYI